VVIEPDLTVFVISAGNNPNLPATLKALERERKATPFKLRRIVDISPLSAAFQRMLDECDTPYFIQCDEDMVLDEGVVGKMLTAIRSSAETISMVAFKLRDNLVEQDIYGIKIYKAVIFKQYPYDLSSPSCEVEQLERMKRDGYDIGCDERVVGQHAPHWTPAAVFERTQNLMEKWKLYDYRWLENLPQRLLEKVFESPTEINMYAFLGAYTSIASDKPLLTGEKDWTKRSYEESVLSTLRGPCNATLYLTSKCNFRCPFCKRETCVKRAPDMNLDTVGDLVARFPSIRAVCMCGFGEPLKHYDLLPFFQYCKFKKFVFGLITNGSLLKSVFIPKIAPSDVNPDYISVSLNASTREEHREYSGTDTWDETLEGISLVQEYGIPVYLTRVCTTANADGIPDFLKLARKLDVTCVHLHNLLPYCDEIQGVPFQGLVMQKNRDEQLLRPGRESDGADLVKTWPVLIDPSEKPQWCEHPYRFVGVDGNGHITICNSVDHPNPDVHVKQVRSIWYSKYAESIRKRVRECAGPCGLCFRNWMVP